MWAVDRHFAQQCTLIAHKNRPPASSAYFDIHSSVPPISTDHGRGAINEELLLLLVWCRGGGNGKETDDEEVSGKFLDRKSLSFGQI